VELPLTECWLSPLVRVGSSSIEGQGLFAARTIPAGTAVSRFGGRLVSDAELRDLLSDSPTYVDTLSIGHDVNLVLPPDVPNHAGNHGCDPNSWWVDPYSVATRRDVAAGEELTLDYGTITDDVEFEMPCGCRASSCRGRITGRDWKLPELQARYADHWVPVLRQRIAEG